MGGQLALRAMAAGAIAPTHLTLIGVPHRVTIGDRGLKEGMVEYQHRRDSASTPVAVSGIGEWIRARLKA